RLIAQGVTNKPMYFEARAKSPCRKSEMSRGSTGAMMPKASMSSRTVTKMKPRAARRLVSMRSLLGEMNRVQTVQPQLHGAVQALAVARGAVIQHETPKTGQDN